MPGRFYRPRDNTRQFMLETGGWGWGDEFERFEKTEIRKAEIPAAGEACKSYTLT